MSAITGYRLLITNMRIFTILPLLYLALWLGAPKHLFAQDQIEYWGTTYYSTQDLNGGGSIIHLDSSGQNISIDFNFNTFSTPGGQLNAPNGGGVWGRLMQSYDGNFYGMCSWGGSKEYGNIFKYSPGTGQFTELYSLKDGHASSPDGGLIQASNGLMYGMTKSGGLNANPSHNGDGTLFEINPSNNNFIRKQNFNGPTTGRNPKGSLIQASNGILYGLTEFGGPENGGTLFEYNINSGQLTKLVDFTTETGVNPKGSLIETHDGILYGTTRLGGNNNMGTIFRYDIAQNLITDTILMNSSNGSNPWSELTLGSNGKLYGTAATGGLSGYGAIIEVDTAQNTYTQLFSFDNNNGSEPQGHLAEYKNTLYGMTTMGGANNNGTIFKVTTAGAFTKLYDLNQTYGMQPHGGLIVANIDAIQVRLNQGETPFQIYLKDNSKLDDLYGRYYQGGFISYLNTTNGSGIIAAPLDLPQNTYGGCDIKYFKKGGYGTAIGTGLDNTNEIARKCSGNSAQNSCLNSSMEGVTEWFLPSIDELITLRTNLYNRGLGNFSGNTYWSSTNLKPPSDKKRVKIQPVDAYNFSSGNIVPTNPTTTQSVRAINYIPAAGPAAITSTTLSYSQEWNRPICSANITSDGGAVITQSGICYATTPNPTIANNIANSRLNKVGPFSVEFDNLTTGTTYYARAFCTNFDGTVYSNQVQFIYSPYLGNNYIITEDQVSCNGIIEQLTGSSPSGGTNEYSYQWQKSEDDGISWENVSSGGTSINHSPTTVNMPIYKSGDKPKILHYRRQVTSGTNINISPSVRVTLLQKDFPIAPDIHQKQSTNSDIILNVGFDQNFAPYTVQWLSYSSGTWQTMSDQTSPDLVLTSNSASPTNFYAATIEYNGGCGKFNSKVINFTPPDGDGNIYPTVPVGASFWTMNNLRTTTDRNGTKITQLKGSSSWSGATESAYCWYDNDSIVNSFKYGALYNYKAINKNICPANYHVATEYDWNNANYVTGGALAGEAGWSMKSTHGWDQPNFVAINNYNFYALPGGERKSNGTFNGIGTNGLWWGAPSQGAIGPTYFQMINVTPTNQKVVLPNNPTLLNSGFSVRCVKNYE